MRAAAVATLRQVPRAALALSPRVRRRVGIALLLAVMLFSVYRLWFRDSSFVSVQHVTVSGLTTADAPRIRTALVAAAHDMTTLDVQQSALNSAVAGFPVVKGVVAQASFPHTLKIRVIEERPVAVLLVGGERLLLSADGTVLRGVTTGHPLALIRSSGSVPQSTLPQGEPLSALRVVAAAPHVLVGRISAVRVGKLRGLFASLRNGPQIFFGDDSRLDAKWAAAVAVLANSSSKGASYVDVRLPERPVAGGVAAQTLTPLTSTGSDATTQSSAQPSAAGATGTTGAANSQLSGVP